MLGSRVPLCLILLLVNFKLLEALTCYIYDSENGITKQSDPSWEYCGYAPVLKGGRQADGRGWGIAASNDLTSLYGPLFENNNELMGIIAVCLTESYDFSKFSPKAVATRPEYVFRCVCNYDRCNTRATFENYFI